MEISGDYLGLDLRLIDCVRYTSEFAEEDPGGRSANPADHAPLNLRTGTIDLLRYLNRVDNGEPPDRVLLRHQLIGVLLTPNEDGTLGDVVGWLLRRIDPPAGVSTETIVEQKLRGTRTGVSFSLVEGLLPNSLLRPIADALAAVVAWGQWDAPTAATPAPSSTTGKEFRKLSKSSSFKRAERRGAIAGVHLLDVRSLDHNIVYTTEDDGPTVRTHYRRGHWRRVRVGPNNDRTYRRTRIPPVIVNAGQNPLADLVRIYRLPPPNPSDPRDQNGI